MRLKWIKISDKMNHVPYSAQEAKEYLTPEKRKEERGRGRENV